MINIINKTLKVLNANDEWQKRYSGYLSDILKHSKKEAKGFHKPEGLSVYTTVGDRNAKTYYLRFKGQNVGKVFVTKNGIEIQSLVKEAKTHNIKGCPLSYEEKVKWNSDEASKFRAFFKALSINTRTKSPEHYVENSLLKEFRKRERNEKALLNIQPVLLQGNFFQMPSPLKASTHVPSYAKQNGGGIDMLARIRTEEGHLRLSIIEIKDENKKEESQMVAMSQAISYATFIATLLQHQPNWMEFFMGHKTRRGRFSGTLDKFDIEVVTIMPKGNTETFENKVIEIPDTQFKLHCHSLYYDKEKFEKSGVFDFSGTFLKEIKK